MPKTKPDLTVQEQDHVRTVLRACWLRFGGREQLAGLLGIHGGSVKRAVHDGTVTVMMAFKLSRLLETSFDELLAGRYRLPGPCPHCGRDD